MIETPAVQTAGGFVLPEGTERFDDKVTISLPKEGLMFDTDFSEGWGYRSITMLTLDGNITVEGSTIAGLAEVSRLYGPFAQHIHVHRPPINQATEFHHNEVMPTHDGNPWLKHKWYRDNFLRWVELLPRPSEKVPGAVAYFQDLDKRVRNIRTPIKPGRFLQKYFGDILTQEQIHEHALEWAAQFEHPDLTITQDADEIETVYKARHLGSCMWFDDDDYRGSCHPARVYAGPDLGIAYIGPSSYPDARVLVWPSKKIYFDKFYGDDARLRTALREVGYSAGYSHDFEGARIRRIRHGSQYVVPYVDCADWAFDDGTYLVLGDGNIELDSTSGTSGADTRTTCEDCGDRTDDDEITYIGHLERDVCDYCLRSNYFFCSGSHEYHNDNDRADTPDTSSAYSEDFVKNNTEWFRCEGNGKWYTRSGTDHITCASDRDYRLSYAIDNGYYCEYSEKWFVDEGWNAKVDLANGTSVNINEFGSKEEFENYVTTEGTMMVCLPSDNQLELALAA